ncbi:MAG TPA: DsbA family protein [Candidatus Paceibacterota bacterium]|nr:DsbA family protein [Candidatus Paceibacterota bacterium]
MANKKDYFLPISILIAGLIIGGAVIYTNGLKSANGGSKATPTPVIGVTKELNILATDKLLGETKAPLTIFEFSDYQCPYCIRYETLSRPTIIDNYVKTGKAKLTFRDYPLPFHTYAQKASEAVWCAGDQNKYWEMHDVLFTKQESGSEDALSVANIKKYASGLGLNTATFNDCLDSNKYQTQVTQNMQTGQDVGVSGTPTVVIAKKLPLKISAEAVAAEIQNNNYIIPFDGGVMIVGAQPASVYQTEIDKLL